MEKYNYRKIYVISDLHFGVRNNSLAWRDMMTDFYRWFMSDVKDNGYDSEHDALFILGDVFHSRESVNIMMLENVCKVFSELSSVFKNIHIITGNHDTYYVDSNSVTTIKILSGLVPGIKCYYEHESIEINSNKVLMLPWVTSFEEIHNIVDSDNSDYLFCHMDINGMKYSSGMDIDKCADSTKLSKYKKIFSGHIHMRQEKGNVIYVGTPYQLDVTDTNNDRGYYVIDGNTFEHKFVKNVVSPKYVNANLEDVLEMDVESAKKILDNNYVEFFAKRKITCNCDLILLKQKLSELGIGFRSMSFSSLNESSSVDEEIKSAAFEFNVYDACVKMLTDAKRSDSEINETMEYFNMLYTMTKNDTHDGIAATAS